MQIWFLTPKIVVVCQSSLSSDVANAILKLEWLFFPHATIIGSFVLKGDCVLVHVKNESRADTRY